MSIYTTPLQFGYFFSLLMTFIYLTRGIREERLSDRFLAMVMLIIALELQDYTFGFSGINFLWEKLNGFPRGVSLLLGPTVYFYLRSQINRNFQLKKSHLIHLLPWALFFLWGLFFFLQGPMAVQRYQQSTLNKIIGYPATVILWASYWFYFTRSLQLYKSYRKWAVNAFSNQELISFVWFRNFIYAMIFWVVCKVLFFLVDNALNLDFYQDWWWNLALVGVAVYVGIEGLIQKQPKNIVFENKTSETRDENRNSTAHHKALAQKLQHVMEEDQLFLQPELSLHELARHLKTNSSLLSATINQEFQKNFNDFVNEFRIQEFIARHRKEENQNFTLLSIAYDCGFNSKATFNRAFKKAKGMSPREYIGRRIHTQ